MTSLHHAYEYDAFVSYSSSDLARVLRAASWLRDHGVRVWLDRWIIEAGEPISVRIEEALARSRVLLAFLSRAALRSHWPTVERHSAIFRDPASTTRRFVPVLLEHVPSLPPLLATYKYVDLSSPTPAAYRQLLKACSADQSTAHAAPGRPRHRNRVEVIVHHIDDEPAQIRWIPGSLMNRLFLTEPGKVDLASFKESAKESSFVLHTGQGDVHLRYVFHASLSSLKRALKASTSKKQVLVADLMLPSADGRFANDGLDALRLAARSIPRTRRFVLTGYLRAITPEVRKLLPPGSVFHKPVDAAAFVSVLLRPVLDLARSR